VEITEAFHPGGSPRLENITVDQKRADGARGVTLPQECRRLDRNHRVLRWTPEYRSRP